MYFDINSTYRNRNSDPNPADFTILPNQGDKEDPRDFCSEETPLFPAFSTPPLAFYNFYTTPTTSETRERTYLPLMYSTAISNVYQLDELPIASNDYLTTQIKTNPLYPRGSIPLGLANEYYTGDVLENFDTNETVRITSFFYDNTLTNNIFQVATVLWSSTLGGITTVAARTSSATTIPVSNIDRYYQGKYIRLLNGDKRLITNYTVYHASDYAVFTVDSPFGTNPSPNDTFQIVSDRKWFATVAEPFSTSIPQYPAYQLPLPSSTLQFSQYRLYSSSRALNNVRLLESPNQVIIGFMESLNVNDSSGLALSNSKFGFSADPQGLVWGDVSGNIAVYDTPTQGNFDFYYQDWFLNPQQTSKYNVSMVSATTQQKVSVNQDVSLCVPNSNNTLIWYLFPDPGGIGELGDDSSIYGRTLSISTPSEYLYQVYSGQDSLQIATTGANIGCAVVNDSTILSLTNLIIEFDYAWYGGAGAVNIVSVQRGASPTITDPIFQLKIDPTTLSISFRFSNAGTDIVAGSYAYLAFADSNWHSFKFVCGSTGIRIYVDQVENTFTYTAGSQTSTTCLANLDPTGLRYYLFGTSGILNANVSNFRLSSFTYYPLLGSYMFSIDDPTQDSSGNGRNCTLVGAPGVTASDYENFRSSCINSTGYFNPITIDFTAHIVAFDVLTDFSLSFLIYLVDDDSEVSYTYVYLAGSTPDPTTAQFTFTIQSTEIRLLISNIIDGVNLEFVAGNAVSAGQWNHILLCTGTNGNKLYVNGQQVIGPNIQYLTGNSASNFSLAYLNTIQPGAYASTIQGSNYYIDSVYFFTVSLLNSTIISQLYADIDDEKRWNIEEVSTLPNAIQWSVQGNYFYNYKDSYTNGIGGIKVTDSGDILPFVRRPMSVCHVLVDDDPNFPQQRLLMAIGKYTDIGISQITQYFISPPQYGICTIHKFGIVPRPSPLKGYQYCYWTVYNPLTKTLNYRFSTNENSPLFTVINNWLTPPLFIPIMDYDPINVRLSFDSIRINNDFYSTIIYGIENLVLGTYDLQWGFMINEQFYGTVPNLILPSLLSNPINNNFSSKIIYDNPRIIIFTSDYANGLLYIISTDNGTTWSNPVTIDPSPKVLSIDVINNDGAIQVSYTRENADGTYSVIMLTEQQFQFGEAVPYRIRRNPSQIIGRPATNPLLPPLVPSTDKNKIRFTNASTTDDAYNNMFLWIYNENVNTLPTAAPFEMINSTYLITDYDGATKTATVSPDLPDLEVISLLPNTNLLNWEILGSTKDTFNGMNYNIPSLLTDRCYTFALTHIILPNATLYTGIGNQVSFYPYIYVKITSVDQSLQQAFYSNNPVASSVTFKVPVSQFTSDPSALPYIRLVGDNRASIRMDITKGFRFSVLLPNGEPFLTVQQDNPTPDLPNPLLQISAGLNVTPNTKEN